MGQEFVSTTLSFESVRKCYVPDTYIPTAEEWDGCMIFRWIESTSILAYFVARGARKVWSGSTVCCTSHSPVACCLAIIFLWSNDVCINIGISLLGVAHFYENLKIRHGNEPSTSTSTITPTWIFLRWPKRYQMQFLFVDGALRGDIRTGAVGISHDASRQKKYPNLNINAEAILYPYFFL